MEPAAPAPEQSAARRLGSSCHGMVHPSRVKGIMAYAFHRDSRRDEVSAAVSGASYPIRLCRFPLTFQSCDAGASLLTDEAALFDYASHVPSPRTASRRCSPEPRYARRRRNSFVN